MLYTLLRRIILPLFGRSLTLEGAENVPTTKGCIIAANHIDYLDGFFIATALLGTGRIKRVRFLSETNNYWWTGGGTIQIDWENKAESLVRAAHAMKNGDAIGIFPEGRRNPTLVVLPGRTGVARLAYATGAPIVPVGLVGPSYGSFGAGIRALLGRKTHVRVVVGRPIYVQKSTNDTLSKDAVMTMTAAVMAELARVCQKTYAASET